MRIFMTGATGYIGSVVTEKAIAEGHTVVGLSRSEKGDAKLEALGATPVRGELTSADVLQRESAQADAVLHLGFIHDFTMDYHEVMRIDALAVDALGAPLHGTGKPLVITSGTAFVEPDPAGGETTESAPISQTFIMRERIESERHSLSLAQHGVRVSALRLPPYVYGRGGSYFAPMLVEKAAEAGESIYVGDGLSCTSDVHVDDAADLFLLAMTKAKAGEVFNGTGATNVSLRAFAETIGEALRVPVRSVSREEAQKSWGDFLTAFVQQPNRASNHKAREQLGWQPKGLDMLTDLASGSYLPLVERLRRK